MFNLSGPSHFVPFKWKTVTVFRNIFETRPLIHVVPVQDVENFLCFVIKFQLISWIFHCYHDGIALRKTFQTIAVPLVNLRNEVKISIKKIFLFAKFKIRWNMIELLAPKVGRYEKKTVKIQGSRLVTNK